MRSLPLEKGICMPQAAQFSSLEFPPSYRGYKEQPFITWILLLFFFHLIPFTHCCFPLASVGIQLQSFSVLVYKNFLFFLVNHWLLKYKKKMSLKISCVTNQLGWLSYIVVSGCDPNSCNKLYNFLASL